MKFHASCSVQKMVFGLPLLLVSLGHNRSPRVGGGGPRRRLSKSVKKPTAVHHSVAGRLTWTVSYGDRAE